MNQNAHTSHAPRLPPSPGGPLGVIGLSSQQQQHNNSNNMNHTNSQQSPSWSHSATNGPNPNAGAGGLTSSNHRAIPGNTPSGAAEHDTKVAPSAPSPESSNSSQGTTLKEHDLLGLSDVSSSNASRQDNNSAKRSSDNFPPEGLNLNLNLGATELRLGPKGVLKQSSGFHYDMNGAASEPEVGTSATAETGSFLGLNAGSRVTEHDISVADRRSSNVDQNVPNPEQQQEQDMDRGFSYSSLSADRVSTQGNRAAAAAADIMEGSACRPLIESESLQKWHGAVDRKASNESLSLTMSLLQQQQQQQQQTMRATAQEDLNEKIFHKSAERNYNEKPQEVMLQQQQQQSAAEEDHVKYSEWQGGKQQSTAQDDVSSVAAEKGVVAQDRVMSDVSSKEQQQQQGAEQQQHERMQQQHEAYQAEKRKLSDGGKALGPLQPPEQQQRFPQDMGAMERSPRHADYVVQQKLWQSQVLMRSAPEFQVQQQQQQQQVQQQQQQQMALAAQEDSSRNGLFSGPRGVVFPASKLAVSGAKRPFDTIGAVSESRTFNESRVSSVSETPSMANANSAPSDAETKAKSQQQPPSYQSWGTKAPTWQMLHTTGGSFGPFPSQAPGRNQMINNPTVEVASAGGDAAQKAWEAHTKSLQQQQDPSASLSQKISGCPSENKPGPPQVSSPPSEGASAPRAAAAAAATPTTHAVGWPPLRSYRKNSIAAHPRPSPVETQPRPPAPPPPQAASPASVASQPNSWFVKVYMDGVPFGRKVDLKSNRSYEKLSLVLEDMFRGFVNGQQSSRDITLPSDKRNFLHGSDYVLTYEDQDGDLMLVGDVPWTMFIDTVKRLRIMKGSEAIGLGNRAAEKANKVQSTV